MNQPLFGTDGFRGEANNLRETGINPATLGRLAYEFVSLTSEESGESPIVIVGSDTRLSSPQLRQAVADGAALAGAEVWEVGVAPTPLIAWLAKQHNANAIAITASHNPGSDNGFKPFARGGAKPSRETLSEVENRYFASSGRISLPSSAHYNRVARPELKDKYVDHVVNRIGEGSLKDMSVIVDAGNGAVWYRAPQIYRRLGASVHEVACKNDGANINNGYGAAHLDGVRAFILANPEISQAENFIGAFASDGDGDRVMGVDRWGRVIDGNYWLRRLAIGQLGIVGTVYTNSGLREAVKAKGVEFYQCENGDSYVTAMLEELSLKLGEGYTRGGEFTGHLIDLKHLSSGDGLYMGAWLAAQLAAEGISLEDVFNGLTLWPEKMVNVKGDNVRTALDQQQFQEALTAEQEALGDNGRIIVRKSGTEPVVRVWAEAETADVNAVTQRLTEVLRTTA